MRSVSTRQRLVATVVAATAVVVGIVAEHVAYEAADVRAWAPDLVVGWGLVALGLTGWILAPRAASGPLVCAAGFAWFVGNFAGADVRPAAWIGEHGAYLHRALLAHAVLAFPRYRPTSGLSAVVATGAYVAALWPALAASDRTTVVLGAAVLGASLAFGEREAIPAAIAFSLATGSVALGHILLSPIHAESLLLLYEAGLLVTAVALVVAVARRGVEEIVVDRVIEFGETDSVRDALARVLGDPSLQIGFRREDRIVDEKGVTLALPSAPECRVTELAPETGTIVVHDPAVVLGERLVRAISRSVRLTSEHARLQAEAVDHVAQLSASRQRLALARGRQRALLSRRLHTGVERRLLAIAEALKDAEPETETLAAALERARHRLDDARETIDSLAGGLQPTMLAATGLTGALPSLTEGSAVPVRLEVEDRRYDAAIEHAAWLFCSEALANVTKHARATAVEVRARVEDDVLRLEVFDDGVGGARLEGSGLAGLAVRVGELGGAMRLESPQGGGTRLQAAIPLRPRAADNVSDAVLAKVT